jgi:hypothetical protein
MFYTLSELKRTIEEKIEMYGNDELVASFIFYKNDVTSFGNDGNEVFHSSEVTNYVLEELGDSDWIYEQILNVIDDKIKEFYKRQRNHAYEPNN